MHKANVHGMGCEMRWMMDGWEKENQFQPEKHTHTQKEKEKKREERKNERKQAGSLYGWLAACFLSFIRHTSLRAGCAVQCSAG